MAGDDGEETGDAFVSRARVWLEPRGRGESRSCLLCYYTYTQSSDSDEFKNDEKTVCAHKLPPPSRVDDGVGVLEVSACGMSPPAPPWGGTGGARGARGCGWSPRRRAARPWPLAPRGRGCGSPTRGLRVEAVIHDDGCRGAIRADAV